MRKPPGEGSGGKVIQVGRIASAKIQWRKRPSYAAKLRRGEVGLEQREMRGMEEDEVKEEMGGCRSWLVTHTKEFGLYFNSSVCMGGCD